MRGPGGEGEGGERCGEICRWVSPRLFLRSAASYFHVSAAPLPSFLPFPVSFFPCVSVSLFHASMNLSRNERTPTADSLGHRLCPVHEREANCPSSLCGRGSAPLYSQGRLLLWCQRRVIGRGRVTSRKLIGWNDRVTIPPLPLAIGYLSVPFSSFTLRNRSLRPQRCSLMAARYWPSLSHVARLSKYPFSLH